MSASTMLAPTFAGADAPTAASNSNGGAAMTADGQPLFTCLSCAIAFLNPEDQRAHYRSDLHRYNMKRRVADLPPVKAEAFNRKILERRAQLAGGAAAGAGEAPAASGAGTQGEAEAAAQEDTGRCAPCGKTFSTANAYRDHITSRKHRETILKKQQQGVARKGGLVNASAEARKTEQGGETADPLVFKVPRAQAGAAPLDETASLKSALPEVEGSAAAGPSTPSAATATMGQSRRTGLALPEDATEEEVQAAIDEKISRSKRIDPNTTCLFCISGGTGTGSSAGPSHQATHGARYSSMDEVLAHMRSAHSFFIPERDYLEDLPGLLTYLADKISVGNICLYCNGKGRGFASREAVQGHMLDKAHCKIAYDAEEDRLELGDFYDFSSTYPDAERYREKLERRKARREEKLRRKGASDWQVIQEEDEDAEEGAAAEQGEWEDEDAEEAEEDEKEYSDLSDSDSDDESDFSDDIPQARLGDSEYELVLPSGLRLGHRSMKRYYDQTSRTTPASADRYTGGASGRELARRLIENGNGSGADKGGTLVKGRNGLVVQAKSKGEAKEAKRHIKEFRDVKRREEFKTKVAYKHNSQKHFRDPFLQ